MEFSYVSELGEVKLDESGPNGTSQSWIQAMPLGAYHHPLHGMIDITVDRVQRFADNIRNKVRGQDLDIDYDHKIKETRAAGWVKDATVKSDGLWVLVEWTKDAAEKIKNREYRYFSPEFDDKWIHPKTKVQFQDVMFGGALTNRPFLKDILPINLSELSDKSSASSTKANEGEPMNDELRKLLAKRLGLAEDATEETVLAKLGEEPSKPDVDLTKAGVTRKDDGSVEITLDGSTLTVPAPENKPAPKAEDAELAKLAESNPAVKALMDEREADRKRLSEVEGTVRLSEVNYQLGELAQTSDKTALSPAQTKLLREAMVSSPKRLSDQVLAFAKDVLENGLVQLSTNTNGGEGREKVNNNNGGEKSAGVRLDEAVAAKIKASEGKLGYADALTEVAAENPKLYEEYTNDIREGKSEFVTTE